MKTIRYILQSYFQQQFWSIVTLLMALFLFIMANTIILTRDAPVIDQHSTPWDLFFFALILITTNMGQHLNLLIRSSSTALLPAYRARQLIAAGLILTVFLVWPIIITAIYGFPILISMAMLFFATSLILWLSFLSDLNIFVIIGILWPLRILYELFDLKPKVKIIPALGPDYQIFLATGLIIISLIGLFFLVRYVLKVSILKFEQDESHRGEAWARDYDRLGNTGFWLVSKQLRKIFSKNKHTDRDLVNLIQYSLLSPSKLTLFQLLGFLALSFYMFTLIYFQHGLIEFDKFFYTIFLFMYFIMLLMLITDFLQHRERLPFLWLLTPVKSRRKFLGLMVQVYLWILFKQFLIIHASFAVLLLAGQFFAWAIFLKLVALGGIIMLLETALSLLFSEEIVSWDAKGWTIANLILGIIGLTVFFQNWEQFDWKFIAGVGFVVVLLFWAGLRKWYETEMDFKGPGMVAVK